MKKTATVKVVTVAVLIAAEIILSRFLSISTPIVKIGFGFLPIAIAAMMFGPVYAGICAALADILGATLFPVGAFFPGFTLTAFLTGITYGIFIGRHKVTFTRICLAVIIISVGLHLGLDTLWLQIITGKGYIALLPVRALKSLIMIPVQVICISIVSSKRFNAQFERISAL